MSYLEATLKHSENCKARRTDIKCLNCATIMSVIPAYAQRKKYCSKNCMFEYRGKQSAMLSQSNNLTLSRGQKPRRGQVLTCICGKEFYRLPYHSGKFKKSFCSRECSNRGKLVAEKAQRICEECGNKYSVYSSYLRVRISKYCSIKCRGASVTRLKSGENSPTWQGGKSGINRRIRGSKRFQDWRKAVFERDNYTCQICFKRGGYLEADHVKPFAYFPDLRFELSNGRTLCQPCHKQTDTYMGRATKLYGMG